MGYIKTEGIIIKEVNIGEADKMLTIFTKKTGKISASAKGARKTRSRLSGGTQLLCYCEFVLFKGNESYSVNTCDIIESFYEIRNDIKSLTYAAHLIDIVNDLIQENQTSTQVLKLLLNTLHMLSRSKKSHQLIISIFELKLLCIIGYKPQITSCALCNHKDMDKVYFSFSNCGFICEECATDAKSIVLLSTGVIKAMIYVIYARLEDVFKFDLSSSIENEFSNIIKRYLQERLEKKYNKLDMLKDL